MKLIINADDFGLTKGVNKAIAELINKNILTSTTLMVNMPEFENAVELIKKYKLSCVGVHLNLTKGNPLTKDTPSLVNNKGQFNGKSLVGELSEYEDAKKEFKTQIEKFLIIGIKQSLLDTHNNIFTHIQIFKAFCELAKEYNLPVRTINNAMRQQCIEQGIKTADKFIIDFYKKKANLQHLKQIINIYKNENITVELMCHPAIVDYSLKKISGYNKYRGVEYKTLIKAKEIGLLDEVALIGFENI